MAGVFRTRTCVMVTSHGSGTSHPNTLPPGPRRGLMERRKEEEEEVTGGEEVARVHSEPSSEAVSAGTELRV